MAATHSSRTIAAAPQDVWNLLADIDAASSWAEKVDHSCILVQGAQPVGTTRRIQIGRDTLIERVTEFDPPNTLAYDVEGLPKLMGKVKNRWTLQPTSGGHTVVTLTTTVEIGSNPIQQLAERVTCRVLARESGGMLAGLANRLEKSRV